MNNPPFKIVVCFSIF